MAGREIANLGRVPKLPGPPTAAGLPEAPNSGPFSAIGNAVTPISGRASTVEEIITGNRAHLDKMPRLGVYSKGQQPRRSLTTEDCCQESCQRPLAILAHRLEIGR